MLNGRLQDNIVNDGDLDTFSDIITNVLGQDDWKLPGTAYDALDSRVSEIYEKAMILPMPPIIARLYQICRMFDRHNPRPLEEIGHAEASTEPVEAPKRKLGLLIEFRDGNTTVANCWWEDRGGTDDAASLVADLSEALDGTDEAGCVSALAEVGGKIEMMDEAAIKAYPGIETVSCREDGIIGIGEGIKRNRKRPGHEVRIDLAGQTVSSSNYLKWGLAYYRNDHADGGFSPEGLPVWKDVFDFHEIGKSRAVAREISEMPDVFAIPGSAELVGTKFPSS